MGACFWKSCAAEALVGVALNIPALGCPMAEHDPIRMVLGVELCDEHFNAAQPSDFIGEELRRIVMIQLRHRNLALPDYDRAFLTRVAFESEEWRTLRAARSK